MLIKDAGGYEIEPKKDSNGNYLFQTPGEPVGIQTQPQSTNGCEEVALLSLKYQQALKHNFLPMAIF